MVIERARIRNGLGKRLAHCKISSETRAGQHDCWKRPPSVSSGLAFNKPARLRLGLKYVRLLSPSYVRKMSALEQRPSFSTPKYCSERLQILSNGSNQSLNVTP